MAEQESFTPQEAAYFESGGAQTEGLGDAAPSSSEPIQQTTDQHAQPAEPTQQPQDQQQQPDQRTVPLAALQEERAERKRIRDELQRMQQQQDALVQRILANQQQPAPQEQQVQIPDYATDPVGHLRATNESLQRQLQQLTSYLSGQHQQQEQMTQQQQQQAAVANFIATHEQEFRAKAPDYDAAAEFLQRSRAEEYRALGMNNPIQIRNALQQDLIAMANIAYQNGTNVAEAAYQLAKARGYKQAAASPPLGADQRQQQDNAARLAAIAQGQQHAASLSQSGGAAPAPMSIEKLLAMSDAEFSKATSGMNWQKLNAELSS